MSDVAVGLTETGERTESDAMGPVQVPANRYWGAQTQRSRENFPIDEQMPIGVLHALALVKKAAATVNLTAGRLSPSKEGLLVAAADDVLSGLLDEEFPLSVWQTGSGTQSNMNVNEVIANRAAQLAGLPLGAREPLHPNDDVNMAQSSNDVFPTAMHVATVAAITSSVLPSLRALQVSIAERSERWADVVKIGRTHLQDAVPLTVGQEWSGWAAQLDDACGRLEASVPGLLRLAAGGTAVGTGLNAPAGFAEAVAAELARLTGQPFVTAPNKFAALGGLDDMVAASASLRGVAVVLHKVANDIRWLGSGPRAGIGELRLPANEPGSSIMPGKVNPTQCEATVMVCVQVLGLDTAVAMAGSIGTLQLNTMRPLVIANVLRSCELLAGAAHGLKVHCVDGIELDERRITELVERSLMLVTALAPTIGYDRASAIAHTADHDGTTLREAALASGFIDAATYDRVVDPASMV